MNADEYFQLTQEITYWQGRGYSLNNGEWRKGHTVLSFEDAVFLFECC